MKLDVRPFRFVYAVTLLAIAFAALGWKAGVLVLLMAIDVEAA